MSGGACLSDHGGSKSVAKGFRRRIALSGLGASCGYGERPRISWLEIRCGPRAKCLSRISSLPGAPHLLWLSVADHTLLWPELVPSPLHPRLQRQQSDTFLLGNNNPISTTPRPLPELERVDPPSLCSPLSPPSLCFVLLPDCPVQIFTARTGIFTMSAAAALLARAGRQLSVRGSIAVRGSPSVARYPEFAVYVTRPN